MRAKRTKKTHRHSHSLPSVRQKCDRTGTCTWHTDTKERERERADGEWNQIIGKRELRTSTSLPFVRSAAQSKLNVRIKKSTLRQRRARKLNGKTEKATADEAAQKEKRKLALKF